MLARLPMPVHVIPGNHDRRETLRDVLPASYLPGATDGFIQYTVEDHPVRLIALDTLVAGASHGALCTERLGFLERALAGGDGRRPWCSCTTRPSNAASSTWTTSGSSTARHRSGG